MEWVQGVFSIANMLFLLTTSVGSKELSRTKLAHLTSFFSLFLPSAGPQRRGSQRPPKCSQQSPTHPEVPQSPQKLEMMQTFPVYESMWICLRVQTLYIHQTRRRYLPIEVLIVLASMWRLFSLPQSTKAVVTPCSFPSDIHPAMDKSLKIFWRWQVPLLNLKTDE